jgi:hypothetical protein
MRARRWIEPLRQRSSIMSISSISNGAIHSGVSPRLAKRPLCARSGRTLKGAAYWSSRSGDAQCAARTDAGYFLLRIRQSHSGRLRSPHAEAGRFKTELPRTMGRLVFDFDNPDGIFEHHPVGPLEVKEARA